MTMSHGILLLIQSETYNCFVAQNAPRNDGSVQKIIYTTTLENRYFTGFLSVVLQLGFFRIDENIDRS